MTEVSRRAAPPWAWDATVDVGAVISAHEAGIATVPGASA